MTTAPAPANQPRRSTADLVNWREIYKGPEQSQENLDFWDMLRKRSVDAQSIIGQMPFVFQPNSVPPMGPQGMVDPAKGPPSRADVQQFIRPGSTFPNNSGATFPTFTPEMKTDLLGALGGLAGKPGFEQLGPLLSLLGRGG
jgi:hypothetical protein